MLSFDFSFKRGWKVLLVCASGLQIGEINGVKVLQHDLFTNDVVYAEVVFDMREIERQKNIFRLH